jgi:ATP-binding cassette, subfamily B, bacterial
LQTECLIRDGLQSADAMCFCPWEALNFLSGGERQRIALARAFLKDAPILVLDEPTSSVDVETEATIIASLERLRAERTTFIIAHRSTAFQGCDRLFRIDRGILREVQSIQFTIDVRNTASAP